MRSIFLFTLTALLFFSCSNVEDKRALLKDLEQKRDDINKQIEKLRSELVVEANDANLIKKVIETRQIKHKPFLHFIKIQGTVESDNNIMIPAQASGVVKKIYVKEGQLVDKGKLMAELDGAIYESQIKELKTNLELATTVFKRQERLWNKNIGSEIQYLQAKTDKESLEQKLTTVEEQYRLTKIIAPISGNVDRILIKENEATAAGMGTIRVVQVSALKIRAKLSEVYQGSVKKGDSVGVEIPLLNKSFQSVVSAVSQVIDQNNRTFDVDVYVPKSLQDIKPNMIVKLLINNYRNPDALIVPLKAVQKTAESSFLFIAKKSQEASDGIWIAEKRFIKPGMYYNNMLEIKDGLQEGEYIIVSGFRDLADGEKVRLADKKMKTQIN